MDISVHNITFTTVRTMLRAGIGVGCISVSVCNAVLGFIYAQQSGAALCSQSTVRRTRHIYCKGKQKPKVVKIDRSLIRRIGQNIASKPNCTLSAKKHLGGNGKNRTFATDMRNRWRDLVARECCVSANILIFRKLKWI